MTVWKNNQLAGAEMMNHFAWRSLQVLGKQGVIFLIFILSAKLLTPYDFGIYNYILAIVFLLVLFADFGISTATSRYVAEYKLSDPDKLKTVLFSSGTIILILAVVISILVLIFGHQYLNEKYAYVLYILPSVFLAPMTALYDGIYRGLERFKQLALISLGTGLISIPFVYFFIKEYGLIGALISQNIFYLILLIVLGIGYRDFSFTLNKNVAIEIGKYSLIVGAVGALYFLFTRVNTLIMGHLSLFKEVGYYELLVKFFLLLLMPFTILAQVVGPKIVSCSREGRMELFKTVTAYSLIFGFTLFVLANIFIAWIVKVFLLEYYTPDFLHALRIYSFILITQGAVIIASNGVATYLGYAKLNLKLLYFLFPINLVGAILILPKHGFIPFVLFVTLVQVASDITYLFLIQRRTQKIS